jgi:hypothetical protein
MLALLGAAVIPSAQAGGSGSDPIAQRARGAGSFQPTIARFNATIRGVVHTSWSLDRPAEGCSPAMTGSGAQRIAYETTTRTAPLVAVRYPRSKQVFLYRRFDPDNFNKLRPAEYVIDVKITRQGSTQTIGSPPEGCPVFDGGGEPAPPDCGDRSHVSRIEVAAASPRHIRWDETSAESIESFLASPRAYRNCDFFQPSSPYPVLFPKNKGLRPNDLEKGMDLTDIGRTQGQGRIVTSTGPRADGVSTTTETTVALKLTRKGE